MNSVSRALRFILAQQQGAARRQRGSIPPQVSCERIKIKITGKTIEADVYTPAKFATNPIVFLHGMSILGVDDPRQKNAAFALASAGFRVICPEIREIRNLKIQARAVTEFSKIVSSILDNNDLCPSGRAALFAPSFSGAICLRAAADAQVSQRISAVCAMGTMAGIRTCIEYLFLDGSVDRYARYVVLANYVVMSKKYKSLAPAFHALALDNWHASAASNPELKGNKTNFADIALKKLSAPKRAELNRILEDDEYRRQLFHHLLPFMEKELRAYAVLPVAKNISAPTFLLHGATDNVLPPSESVELAQLLEKKRLVISPFIGHAETAVSLSRVADIWRLVSGFAYFFRHAAKMPSVAAASGAIHGTPHAAL